MSQLLEIQVFIFILNSQKKVFLMVNSLKRENIRMWTIIMNSLQHQIWLLEMTFKLMDGHSKY